MKKIIFLLMVLIIIILSSCSSNNNVLKYYSDPENYVTAVGTVTHIKYNEENNTLYLGIDQLTPEFSDNSFKIVGDNLTILKSNGIDQKMNIGQQIEFMSAPRYFGDGYVMPIVAIAINGETLLNFDQGYENLIEWLSS